MTTLTFSVLDNPETIPTALTHGICTMDDIDEAKDKYRAFIHDLHKEWPPERLREYQVQRKRDQYKKAALLIQKLELDNRDARVRGVSYKDRESFTAKIKTGYLVVQKIKKDGADAKRANYHVQNLVRPSDMDFVQAQGMEKHLEYTLS